MTREHGRRGELSEKLGQGGGLLEAVGNVFTNYENRKIFFSLKVTSGGSSSGFGASFSGEEGRGSL